MDDLDQQYNGEFRYVNLGPAQVRRRLESERDPAERMALATALEYWRLKSPTGVSAGQSFRGEPCQAIHAKSMRSLAAQVKPVEHVFVRGSLSDKGASLGVTLEGDVIDWEMLKGDADGSNDTI